ncbi:hypothetical protein EON65_15540, partial [archaeon]
MESRGGDGFEGKDGGEEMFHDIDIGESTKKPNVSPEHLQKVTQILQKLNSDMTKYCLLLHSFRTVDISKAQDDVVKASENLIQALNRFINLSQGNSTAEDKRKQVCVSSSQGTSPFVRVSSMDMEVRINPPLSTPTSSSNTTSSSNAPPVDAPPFFSSLLKPKLVAVSKASSAARMQSSLYSEANIKFDRIVKAVPTAETKPVVEEEEIGYGKSVAKESKSEIAIEDTSSKSVGSKVGESKGSNEDNEDTCYLQTDTVQAEKRQGGGALRFLQLEEIPTQNSVSEHMDDVEDSSQPIATSTSRRSSRGSIDATWLCDQSNEPYYIHSEKIDGTLFRFIMTDDFYGRVTVKPNLGKLVRRKFEVCFCNHRHLQHQADYVFCNDGRVCNHFVHKNCVQNSKHLSKTTDVLQNLAHYAHYVCHMCAAQQAEDEDTHATEEKVDTKR